MMERSFKRLQPYWRKRIDAKLRGEYKRMVKQERGGFSFASGDIITWDKFAQAAGSCV